MRRLIFISLPLVLAACGGSSAPARVLGASQALTLDAELLELESPAVRKELFAEVTRTSRLQAGQPANGPVFFPIASEGTLVAAPGLEAQADLLQAPDAGRPLALSFEGRERWPEDRRESLQGLSEREAAQLVASTLLSRWGVHPQAPVLVERASGAPYAAAYVDGTLRINPAFITLAASAIGASQGAGLQ